MRNQIGLTKEQIEYCKLCWDFLCEESEPPKPLDLSIKINKIKLIVTEASQHSSKTRFDENQKFVILGADAYSGKGMDANSRMSVLACLAHELAHTERFQLGYQRPFELPDMLIDEAETSLHASFVPALNPRDRTDLIEDAKDRINRWIDESQR